MWSIRCRKNIFHLGGIQTTTPAFFFITDVLRGYEARREHGVGELYGNSRQRRCEGKWNVVRATRTEKTQN